MSDAIDETSNENQEKKTQVLVECITSKDSLKRKGIKEEGGVFEGKGRAYRLPVYQ